MRILKRSPGVTCSHSPLSGSQTSLTSAVFDIAIFGLPFAASVRPVGERSEDFDQDVVAAKPERGRLHWYTRSCTSELVGEDCASGRDGFRHGLDKNVDTGAVEGWKRARLHERAPPVHDMRIEYRQRSPVADRVQGIVE